MKNWYDDSENFDICAVSTRPTLLSSEFDDEFDNIMFVPLEIWMSDWLFQINLDTSSYVFTQFLINFIFEDLVSNIYFSELSRIWTPD